MFYQVNKTMVAASFSSLTMYFLFYDFIFGRIIAGAIIIYHILSDRWISRVSLCV